MAVSHHTRKGKVRRRTNGTFGAHVNGKLSRHTNGTFGAHVNGKKVGLKLGLALRSKK